MTTQWRRQAGGYAGDVGGAALLFGANEIAVLTSMPITVTRMKLAVPGREAGQNRNF